MRAIAFQERKRVLHVVVQERRTMSTKQCNAPIRPVLLKELGQLSATALGGMRISSTEGEGSMMSIGSGDDVVVVVV